MDDHVCRTAVRSVVESNNTFGGVGHDFDSLVAFADVGEDFAVRSIGIKVFLQTGGDGTGRVSLDRDGSKIVRNDDE